MGRAGLSPKKTLGPAPKSSCTPLGGLAKPGLGALTTQSRSGSTIRLGWKKALPPAQMGTWALYFNCNSNLVDTFRTLFPHRFQFEGNRAIVFAPHEAPESDALALCIRAALNYHRDKKPSRRA